MRVEPVTCPKCQSDLTRVIDKVQLYCLSCGEWSDPRDSPSVKVALAEKTVKGRWESYNQQVLHPEAGPVQRLEKRRAFYAGAQAMLAMLLGGLGRGSEPTTDDLRLIGELEDECARFRRDAEEGLA